MVAPSLSMTTREQSDVANFSIGMKVISIDNIGIIRYIGELEGYSGQWLGIDWYNEDRGKHNGTVNGRTYFTARSNTSGSFVRPQKVSIGVSVAEALRRKYGETTGEEQERIIQEKLESVSKSINAPFLQLVGFEKLEKKQSDFKELKVVGLRMVQANGTGDPIELGQLCPNMHELDLSKNLFTNWNTIFEICRSIEKLRRLNVSENELIVPEDIPVGILSQLSMIICGEMNLTWHDIVNLSQAWPNVEELRCPLNNITNLDTHLNLKDIMGNVKTLYLQNNEITSWQEINKLGCMKSLEKLILTKCTQTEIHFPDCDVKRKTKLFPKLQCLSIAENLINNWQSIQELDKLESLTELRCTKNPIDSTLTAATIFQIIVARVGNLKNLNGTDLLPEERRGAEYDYMKMYANEYITTLKDPVKSEDFEMRHPRYSILVTKYGIPEEAQAKMDANITSSLIELEIYYDEAKIVKKLPPNMLVPKFLTLVQRLFKLDFTPKIFYVSAKDPSCERDMDISLKDLGYYSLQNGDKIFLRRN